jgi:dipeptidyl aminopeptidase/acylaminoacyl peptidase
MNDDLERKEKVVRAYGTPEANPEFWAGLNGEPYLNRLAVPLQIYHGTSDDDVPLTWSENTEKLLKAENKQSELIIYPGEEHEFGPRWTDFMEGMKQFIES